MGIRCGPPLIIYRLNYVDFCNWSESAEAYRAGLSSLLAALEEALSGNIHYRTWEQRLEPWDFAALLNEKRQHFCGREWLFREIDQWRQQSDERALLIVGDPGAGKSAIVAELVFRNPGGQVIAYHCCQADTQATLEPGRFVRSVAAMIASRIPAFAARLAHPAIASALTASSSDADPATAFEAGVLAPLADLTVPEEGHCYFLVDALDEAFLGGKRGMTIVDLLAPRLERLPSWLKVVATTRREKSVLSKLQGLRAKTLDAQGAENQADVAAYLAQRLASPELAKRLSASKLEAAEAAQLLREKSAGNFLYLQQALRGIERDVYRFDRLDALPPGLAGLYLRYFERHFPDDASYRVPKAILGVAIAAREPLSLRQIAFATDLDRNAEVLPAIASLSGYFPEIYCEESSDARYAIYHKSLKDWLTMPQPDNSNCKYILKPELGRDRLIAFCRQWREFQDHYAFAHLAEHLAEAGATDELRALLTKPNFIKAQKKALGDEYIEIDDFRLLTAALVRDRRDAEIVTLGATRNPFQRDGVISAVRDVPREADARVGEIVRGWLKKHSDGHETLNAKLSAIRVAYLRGMRKSLEYASHDNSPQVRDILIPYLFLLWRERRDEANRLLRDLITRTPGRFLPINPAALQVAQGLTFMILAQDHSAEVSAALGESWAAAIRKIRTSPLFRLFTNRLMIAFLVRALKIILSKQPSHQAINKRELFAAFARPPEAHKEIRAAIAGLERPELGYDKVVALLLKRDRPFDVIEMLLSERLLIYQGVRDPDGVITALLRIHREGCPWYGQSAIYVGYHVLDKAARVEEGWLEKYAEMSREIIEAGAIWSSDRGTYTMEAHLASMEALFERHRPTGQPRFVTQFYEAAMARGDEGYAKRVILACYYLGVLYRQPLLALNGLSVALDNKNEEVRRLLIQVLARIRFFSQAAVDHFLHESAPVDLRHGAMEATPIISANEFAAWFDEATIHWLLHSEEFRLAVHRLFARAAEARSATEIFGYAIKWGVNLIAQERIYNID